jgi:hypothetical protein
VIHVKGEGTRSGRRDAARALAVAFIFLLPSLAESRGYLGLVIAGLTFFLALGWAVFLAPGRSSVTERPRGEGSEESRGMEAREAVACPAPADRRGSRKKRPGAKPARLRPHCRAG